jgi:Zn-finger nucleic acid-binding protein
MTDPSHDSRLARVKEQEEKAVLNFFGTVFCPRCGNPLQGCGHSLGIAWRCRTCGGQSLNFSQFRRMVPRYGADAIWNTATARPVPPLRRTLCPECGCPMAAVCIPLNGRQVELDICQPCQRLWLDPQAEDERVSISLPVHGADPVPKSRPASRRHPPDEEGGKIAVYRRTRRFSLVRLLIIALILFSGVLAFSTGFLPWNSKSPLVLLIIIATFAARFLELKSRE